MSSSGTLNKYLQKFARLNRAPTVYGKAPHKPVLLISVIDLIEQGVITANRIYVDTDLVAMFQENWRLLVNTPHQPDFTQPFYYLQSEKIEGEQLWFLQTKPGCQINAHIKSVIRLAQVLEYAFFSSDLYLLLINPAKRNLIKTVLVDTYFPVTKMQYIESKNKGGGYIHEVEAYLFHRAFDRGLITIDNSYRLVVSGHIAEVEDHPYSLRNLDGRKIRLPFSSRHYPAPENLDWHRNEIFKG